MGINLTYDIDDSWLVDRLLEDFKPTVCARCKRFSRCKCEKCRYLSAVEEDKTIYFECENFLEKAVSEDKEKLLEGTFSKRELQLIKNALVKLVFENNPGAEIKVTPLEKKVLSKIEGMLLILDLGAGECER